MEEIKTAEKLWNANQKIEALQAEIQRLKDKQMEWEEARQGALEIIRYDETLAKQSPYWRSMLLSLVEGLSIESTVLDKHIDFNVHTSDTGEMINIGMKPITPQGTKLIQVWGVMDMLKELVESLKIQG